MENKLKTLRWQNSSAKQQGTTCISNFHELNARFDEHCLFHGEVWFRMVAL